MVQDLLGKLQGYWQEFLVLHQYFVVLILPLLIKLWVAGAVLVFVSNLGEKGEKRWKAIRSYFYYTRHGIALLLAWLVLTQF